MTKFFLLKIKINTYNISEKKIDMNLLKSLNQNYNK